ncbi:hypothetical protein Tco_0569954 [Tanacetum coccineum]
MVSNNASKVSTQTEIKDIPIIELSDDEDAVPVKRKCHRLVKNGCLIKNNVVEIVSSDDDKGESLADTKMVDVDIQKRGKNEKKDFNDDEPITFTRSKKRSRSSLSKSHAFCLIDEDSDEEVVNDKTTDNNTDEDEPSDEMDELDDFSDDEDAIDV